MAFSAVQELITENRDKSGAIQSLSLERTGANKLSATDKRRVTRKLEQTRSLPIPVGTLSGISFLSGKGFDYHFISAVSALYQPILPQNSFPVVSTSPDTVFT